ncbi:hypothetical protein [Acinetobacter sp. TW_SC_4]
MNELVQEFEKTRTFKYFCSTLLKFDESLNCYVATEKWRNKEAELLTAAWWMFQEEHSKTQEMDEVIKLQDADLRKYEKQIESLKEQLNNMEACYIQVKKEVEDQQKRIDEYKKLTTSIRNEFDLWSDDSEFADVIEAQIENLEALRGEHE